jgi:hypothetical protein
MDGLSLTMSAYLLEVLIGRRQTSLLAREGLPTLDRDVHVDRRQLHCETGPARHFCRDDCGPGSTEWFVHRLPWRRIVLNWSLHAFDRLLRPVPRLHAQGKPDAKTTGDMKADGKSKASDSTTPTTTSKEMKNPTAETKSPSDSKAVSETKADSKAKAPDSTTTSKDLKTPTAESRPSTPDSKTTGNAATAATAAPPAEKRTQITSAIKQEKVEEVTNVNFNVSIGTAVPAGIRYHPMPSRIVEIYPEWRGYDFILVHGKYVILRPQTHEIVYIIEG